MYDKDIKNYDLDEIFERDVSYPKPKTKQKAKI